MSRRTRIHISDMTYKKLKETAKKIGWTRGKLVDEAIIFYLRDKDEPTQDNNPT